ncbi:MAG: MerR family DNA-binding transcriptional regulator [Deltaproteobacteria bacterium]|nr:MerR family DNA-binding transcriptional regulator [Deltaproteobacteria bacterium]
MLNNVEANRAKNRSLVQIKEAAKCLGIHPDTLRRWVATGKLPCRRHPINGYRLFELTEIYKLIGQIYGNES